MNGVYNAVAPKPVTNKVLTLQLAKAMKSKFYVPVHVPSFVLKTMLGEMSTEVLKSATVSADKVRDAIGFNFIYPIIQHYRQGCSVMCSTGCSVPAYHYRSLRLLIQKQSTQVKNINSTV